MISSSIPNLVNGVSQQSASLRQASQCEEQENGLSSVVEGLRKRPPTEHIAKLINGAVGSAYIHIINRDLTERYVVIVTSGSVRVFTLAGVEKTVNAPDGYAYVTNASPGSVLRCMTVNDYTFVVNTAVTVGMTADLTANRGPEGIIYVRQGLGNQTYTITVDGATAANVTPPAAPSTASLAESIRSAMATSLGAAYTIVRNGSTIHVKRVNGADFVLKGEDSAAGTAMKVFKKSIQRFSDLPSTAPTGYVIEVKGDNSSQFDNYYVKFIPNNATATFDDGMWKETVAEGVSYKLDPATMPHVLVREADGTFTFKRATWGNRESGDADTNPPPSFVGNKLNDIFFHKNRLGFLSDTNAIMSASGDFFTFFRSSVVALLDDNVIDVSASHTKVPVLRSAIAFNEKLLVFSDQTQFVLKGGELLTPKTAQFDLTTEFESSTLARPVNAGSNVFFPANRGNFSSIMEYFIDSTDNTNDAAEITAHVPKYVPSRVVKLAASTNENILLALAETDRTAVFPYKYFWSANQKLQSSWSKWTFNGATVLNMDFIESDLYLVLQRTDGVYLEKINIAPGRTDDGVEYLTHLDRRITDEQCAVTYDAATDRTSYALPYGTQNGATYQVVTRYKAGDSTIPGILLQGSQLIGSTLSVAGDQRGVPVWIGEKYTLFYRFSEVTLKEDARGGGSAIISEGRLQLLFMTLVYDNTGYFKAQVEYDHRPNSPSIKAFTGRVLGSIRNKLGRVAIEKGTARIFVNAKADECSVSIINDSYLPCAFQSAGWEGDFSIRSRRV